MSVNAVEEALFGRRSVRAFLPEPVSGSDVAELLVAARSAPSGANLQPGRFHALSGAALAGLTDALAGAIASHRPEVAEYSYFPDPMPAELQARRRAAGFALYGALGIDRRDIAARRTQFDRNYRFFDAPVGIVVSIDRGMGKGCYMDLGMALMALQMAAKARGLGTCGVGALAKHADVVHDFLDLDDEELVVCGVALGWPDTAHPVNQFRTTRAPLTDFAELHGFDD